MFGVEHDGSVVEYDDSVLQMCLYSAREHLSLDILSHLFEPFGAQLMIHSYYILFYDRALVKVFRSVMGCCTDHLHAPFIGSSVGTCSLECGEECVMDVDDLSSPILGELRSK